jgi:hypothetical protein
VVFAEECLARVAARARWETWEGDGSGGSGFVRRRGGVVSFLPWEWWIDANGGREASRGNGCRDEVWKPWLPSMEWYAHTMAADIAFHGMGAGLTAGWEEEQSCDLPVGWGGGDWGGTRGGCAHGRVPMAAGAAAGAGARGQSDGFGWRRG